MKLRAKQQAFRVALIYVIVAGCWILCMDGLVKVFFRNPEERMELFIVKVCGFVIVTGGLLHWVWRRLLQRWEQEIMQREKSEQNLRRTERALKTISACNGVLVRATSESMLLADICRVLIENSGYRLAWVGFAENDAQKSVRIAAHAGYDEGYLDKSGITWSDAHERGCGPTGTAIRTNQIVVCNNFQTDPKALPWRVEAAKRGFASNIVLPLRNADMAIGALALYAAEINAFNPTEIELLTELADDLAYGIQALRARSEHALAVEALRASEGRLQFLLTATPAIIYSLRPTGEFAATFVSPNVRDVLGYESETFNHDPMFWLAHVHPDDVLTAVAGFAKLPTADTISREYRFRHCDGSYRWIHDEMRVVKDIRGEAQEFVGYWFDITGRKQTEASLKLFRELIERSNDQIHVADPATGRFLDVNDSACRALGYTRDEMLELTVVDITVGGDHTGYDATNAMVRNAGHATLEVWHRRKDGTTYLAEVSLSSVTLDREYSVAIVRDITSRKQQTDELRRKTAFLEALIGSSRDGIVAVDNNGEKVFQNQRVADLWKIAPEIAGNPDDQVQNLFAMEQIKDPAGFAEKNRRILSQPDELAQDEIELKNGTVLDRQTSPVKDDQGKTHGRVWIFRDVTKSRQLEAHLRQTQKMEAIGTLAGGIAHDFNNILSALLMQVALISMIKSLPGEVRDGLEQIRADTNRAADLTRRLLLFSRRQVMQSRILDLNEVITNLAKMLQRIIGEDVRLQLNLHPVALMTRADAGMIEQVLMNLAVNARDAMPEGGMLNIETAETDVTEQIAVLNPDAGLGRYVSFSVSDAGSGIPPEILPRIFEPFFTTKEAGKGTGLGLATVFGIVKQHLGWIEVDNRPGLGATFRIFLPASTAKEAETTQTTVKPKPRGGSETILLAEDEPRVRESISRILGQRGYKVVSAANAIEALDLWRVHRQQVALLLTDLVMPGGMTGHELARQLRAAQANLKIIFISGYSAEIGGRELQLGNGEVFVQKPFVPDHLLETIRQCLDG